MDFYFDFNILNNDVWSYRKVNEVWTHMPSMDPTTYEKNKT